MRWSNRESVKDPGLYTTYLFVRIGQDPQKGGEDRQNDYRREE